MDLSSRNVLANVTSQRPDILPLLASQNAKAAARDNTGAEISF